MSSTCPFCDTHHLASRLVHVTTYVQIFLSDPALTRGHLLVAPTRHIEQPWELSKVELCELFAQLFKYQKILSKTLGTGCDIRQHYRPFMQQNRLKIDHVHFHLLPRTFKDELYQESMMHETDIFRAVSIQETEEIKTILNNYTAS